MAGYHIEVQLADPAFTIEPRPSGAVIPGAFTHSFFNGAGLNPRSPSERRRPWGSGRFSSFHSMYTGTQKIEVSYEYPPSRSGIGSLNRLRPGNPLRNPSH